MYAKRSAALMVAVGSIALASCARMPTESLYYPVMMPVRAEPPFELAGRPTFDADSENQAAVRDDALLSQLYDELPDLMTNRAGVTRKREEPIVSNGKPYRRVWLTYQDTAMVTMQGACGQNIHMWLAPSGEVAEIYVGMMMCPLMTPSR
ncbi:hypothetical protein [Lysobacter capsici]|uniref:hypothetical protein n=1 Tax=Lysobacter capsici TaxID=435897 RepID=UPI001C008246|nr:hypothetical protein [Lysobacter capsici]QWF16579.1 hypothetical protein KME82_22980 [Lysobacter capsici]